MPSISKVSINGSVYDIKDTIVREEIANLGTAAYRDVAALISDTDGKIADAATVKAYVDAQVGQLHNFTYTIVTELPTPTRDTMYIIYLRKIEGGKPGDTYEEFITLDLGESADPRYVMEKIGDTNIDITGYVPTSRTIAGIALSADISAAALIAGLGLTAFATADTASGTVPGQTISGVKATGEVEGSLSGDLGYTSTPVASSGSFTPSGSVSGTVTASGNVELSAASGTEGIEVSGTVGAPTITVELAKADPVLGSVASPGAVPTLNQEKYDFALSGITAAMDTTDTEMLVLTDAVKRTASNVLAFDAGSMPTFETKNVVSGVSKAEASQPDFKGDRIKASFTGASADISASFDGAPGTVNVSGNYDKANVGTLGFEGGTAELDVDDIVVAAKSVTVTPDA